MILRYRGGQVDLSTPIVMGILNVTPDSFSDGNRLGGTDQSGCFRVSLDAACEAADRLVAEGAGIVDVGGESTRPGAPTVSTEEELERVIPVVAALADRLPVPISVDTSNPEVMRAAIQAGAVMVNDIRALQRLGALETAAETGAAVCLMHMQGEPGTMQQQPHYGDVVSEVVSFLRERMVRALAAGIPQDHLVLDPGFGFGKTLQHNYQLLAGLAQLAALGPPVLAGVSRKSMIGQVTGRPVTERVSGSVAAAVLALERGARILRVHDVSATLDAIRIHCALREAMSEGRR